MHILLLEEIEHGLIIVIFNKLVTFYIFADYSFQISLIKFINCSLWFNALLDILFSFEVACDFIWSSLLSLLFLFCNSSKVLSISLHFDLIWSVCDFLLSYCCCIRCDNVSFAYLSFVRWYHFVKILPLNLDWSKFVNDMMHINPNQP